MEGLLQNLKEGLTLFTGSGHKATQRSYSPGQALNIFSVLRVVACRARLLSCLDLPIFRGC